MEQQNVVGIGAQKAGTSWLGNYLAKHPEFSFSPIKELHVFDCIDNSELCDMFHSSFSSSMLEHAKSYFNRKMKVHAEAMYLLSQRAMMIEDILHYKKFFESLLRDEHKCFGEITPSYSLLSDDGYKNILSLYPNAKFIFMMRDPVERFWSVLRFNGIYKKLMVCLNFGVIWIVVTLS